MVISGTNNMESELIAAIERLELDARNIRRRVEHVRAEADKRVLNRQLQEIEDEIKVLRSRLD
jgi:hypothetical protein